MKENERERTEREREREMIKKKAKLTRIASRSLLVEAEEGGWKRSGGQDRPCLDCSGYMF